jgi:uncharacterized membrane protein YphA (DoxX/SURF4 family)
MRLLASPRHLPQRVATGAFILNSGVKKLTADDEAAAQLQGFTAAAYPFAAKLKARDFKRLLAGSEITLGVALLLPVIPSAVAGVALAAFSAGLMGMYARVPGLRKQGSVQPTEEGIPLAQDIWLMGIALGLLVDDLVDNWSSTGDMPARSPER